MPRGLAPKWKAADRPFDFYHKLRTSVAAEILEARRNFGGCCYVEVCRRSTRRHSFGQFPKQRYFHERPTTSEVQQKKEVFYPPSMVEEGTQIAFPRGR